MPTGGMLKGEHLVLLFWTCMRAICELGDLWICLGAPRLEILQDEEKSARTRFRRIQLFASFVL